MMSSSSATTDGDNTNKNNNRYVVTRNGILLPWGKFHQQYKPAAVTSDDGSFCNNADTYPEPEPSANNIALDDDDNCTPPMDASALLQLLPRGAYTTCRTVKNGTHIYQFDYHVNRLTGSASSILQNIVNSSNINHDDDDDDDGGGGGSKTTISSNYKSNHPILHDRTPSLDEVQHLQITNEAWTRDMVLKCIRCTINEFCNCYHHQSDDDDDGTTTDSNNNSGSNRRDFRITLLATWEKNHITPTTYKSVLYCHVGYLPQSSLSTNTSSSEEKKRHIKVLIHGHGRSNALAKDSKWVIDRKKLISDEETTTSATAAASSTVTATVTSTATSAATSAAIATAPSYEEIILLNDKGELLEGTQTNFYVIVSSSSSSSGSSSSLITANEDILHGSVRDSVLRVCNLHNIKVELRPPTLFDLQHASGVFITSTSRLVMPVHEVVLGDLLLHSSSSDYEREDRSCDKEEGGEGEDNIEKQLPASYCYPNCETTEKIRLWVLEDVETHSTPVY